MQSLVGNLKSILIIILLATNVLLYSSQSTANIVDPKDYPIFLLHLIETGPKTTQDLAAEIDNAIFEALGKESSEILPLLAPKIFRSFLSSLLSPGTRFQIFKGVRGFVTPVDPKGEKFTGSANLTEIMVAGSFAKMPLTLRWILMHEVLGHYSQYLRVYELYYKKHPNAFETLMAHPIFAKAFSKLTHPTAAVMELQFFHVVPLSLVLQEFESSELSPEIKNNMKGWMTDLYQRANASPQDYVKYKARLEATLSGGPGQTSITDAEFDTYFEHIKIRGINLTGLKSLLE